MRATLALIGLMSDSHGRAGRTAQALRMLIDRGAEVVIHLGDVGDESVLDALVERLDEQGRCDPPVHVVFGNVDGDPAGMGRYAEAIGLICDHPAGRLTFDGKTLAFTHGDRPHLLDEAIAEGVDYLAHGHTHLTRDDRVGRTRVVNPGALHRAAWHTVALLDTEADRLTIVRLPSE